MMFDNGVIVGEVFKHISRDIWVQVADVGHSTRFSTTPFHYVVFDVLIGDNNRINNGEAETVLAMSDFCLLFDPSPV